jgi:hypothetical protein
VAEHENVECCTIDGAESNIAIVWEGVLILVRGIVRVTNSSGSSEHVGDIGSVVDWSLHLLILGLRILFLGAV